MLKYPCLVLDHDDTVVASEIAVNYPCFLEGLEKFRPGEYMDHPEFVRWCFHHEFADFLRIRYNFTPAEAAEEYEMWKEYAKTHIPPVCEGMKEIMESEDLSTAILVSDPLHMKRSMMMAKDYKIEAFSSPTPTTRYQTTRTKLPFLARETFFYVGYQIYRIFVKV